MKRRLKIVLFNLFPRLVKAHYFKSLNHFNWKSLFKLHFEPELLILEFYFKHNSSVVFFDVGANKGEYVFIAEKHLHPQQIHAFEPNPKLNYKLKRLFNNINLNPFALSNSNGIVEFKVPYINDIEDDSLGTLMINGKENGESKSDKYNIETLTLDRYCFKNNVPRVDCIKIDVEGFELKVLEGGKQLLQLHQPVLLVEIEKRHHNNKSITELSNEICKNYGVKSEYKVFYFNPATCQLEALVKEPTQKKEDWGTKNYINNFIFIPENHQFMGLIEKINKQK